MIPASEWLFVAAHRADDFEASLSGISASRIDCDRPIGKVRIKPHGSGPAVTSHIANRCQKSHSVRREWIVDADVGEFLSIESGQDVDRGRWAR